MAADNNLTWHNALVTKEQRATLYGHRPALIWLTGLSGSGKSTIAQHLDKELFKTGMHSYVLDGDNIRHGLNSDLGFSAPDRQENIRRIGEVASLFIDAGFIVTTAFISPFRHDRDRIRDILEPGEFLEVHVKCSLDECRKRDPKGLYEKALAGEIKDFTGISSPYEPPLNPELTLDTGSQTIQQSVQMIFTLLIDKKIIPIPNNSN